MEMSLVMIYHYHRVIWSDLKGEAI